MSTHLVRYDLDDRGDAWCGEPLTPTTAQTDEVRKSDCPECLYYASNAARNRVRILDERIEEVAAVTPQS